MALKGQKFLIVGGSRGIGAATALKAAALGGEVLLTYRSHADRARKLVDQIRLAGGVGYNTALDVTELASITHLTTEASRLLGQIDFLIHCASGGLEIGAPISYASQVNTDGPSNVVLGCLDLLKSGALVVFLTSHEAHFFGNRDPYPPYEIIARTKNAGECKLRALRDIFEVRQVNLNIVTAEIVADSYTAKLLERGNPGLIDALRQTIGELPTSQSVADGVLNRCLRPQPFGDVLLISPAEHYRPRRNLLFGSSKMRRVT